jgi:hypothetical protein
MQFSLERNVQSLLRKHLFNTISCKNTDIEEKQGHFRKASLVLNPPEQDLREQIP